jgi:hypothetical protein
MPGRRHTLLFTACLLLVAAGGAYLAVHHRDSLVSEDLATLTREVSRHEDLVTRTPPAVRLRAGKHEVIAKVTAGRLTLREAACRFRELHAQQDDGTRHILRIYPAASEEESLCRNVLAWVEEEVRNNPGVAAVLTRLATEYREQFGHEPRKSPRWSAPLPRKATPAHSPMRGSLSGHVEGVRCVLA